MFAPKGPVAGSFQHTLLPCERASEVAILVSRAFAFVFSWYKFYRCTFLRELFNIQSNFFFEFRYFGPDLRLA